MREVRLETDVLVAGGGLAGVCAAIAAARHGARVVLVQDRSRLGGNSSSEVKMHVVGANQHTARPGWRESGLIEELRLADAVNNPQRCWELWDLLLYDKVVSEPNITLLLETTRVLGEREGRPHHRGGRALRQERASLPHHAPASSAIARAIRASAWRPAPTCASGREARAEFGESLAPGEAGQSHARLQHPVYVAPVSQPDAVHAAGMGAQDHQRATEAPADHELGVRLLVDRVGRRSRVIADNERIRFELLSIVMGVWDYIKNSGEFPDSKHWAMDWVGMMPGKRGSRRLLGDYLLTQQDLMQGSFPDCGGHRRLGHGRPSAGGLRPPRSAAQHGADAAGGLRHPAALALQPQYLQPDDGRAATSAPATWRSLRRA